MAMESRYDRRQLRHNVADFVNLVCMFSDTRDEMNGQELLDYLLSAKAQVEERGMNLEDVHIVIGINNANYTLPDIAGKNGASFTMLEQPPDLHYAEVMLASMHPLPDNL